MKTGLVIAGIAGLWLLSDKKNRKAFENFIGEPQLWIPGAVVSYMILTHKLNNEQNHPAPPGNPNSPPSSVGTINKCTCI